MSKKIKSIQVFQNDDDTSKAVICARFEYDQNNRLLLEAEYSDGELINSTALKYDEKGNVIEEVHAFVLDGIEQKNTYKRDENGKILQAEIHYADGSISIRKQSRDNNTQTIIISNEDDQIEGTEIKEFDASGNIITEIHKDETGSVIKEIKNEYDERGLRIRSFIKSENDNSEQTIGYDEKKRLTMKKISDLNGSLLRKILIEYNDDDSVSKEYVESYEYSTVKFFNQYTYNEKGALSMEERIHANGTIEYQQTYEYDEGTRITREVKIGDGNMIEKIYRYEFFE